MGRRAEATRLMFDRVAPRYDLLNRVLTLGMDVGWRRRAVEALALPAGSPVLDLACGTGDLCRALARSGHRPIGVDFSAAMLARATRRVVGPLVRADVLRLPLPDGAVNGVTCGFALRNVEDLGALLAEMARVLRPGGRLAILEVATPGWGPARLGHRLYLRRVVPLIGGLLSDRAAYEELYRSFAWLPPADELVTMLRAAGFVEARREPLSLGIAQLLVASRPRRFASIPPHGVDRAEGGEG